MMNSTELERVEQQIRGCTHLISIPESLRTQDDHHQLLPLLRQSDAEVQRTDVTVVIPTHRQIPVGLEAFKRQSSKIHVLLNAAVDIPHVSGVQIRLVSWKGHGQTRQKALQHVDTPYVFFSVDDAIPLAGCLNRLIEEMEGEGGDQWDALISRQIPFPTADRYTKDQLALWTPHADRTYPVSQCDHVGTLYRTETLRDHPIPNVSIAEDAWWSKGKRIGCVPNAYIVHSHPRHTLALMKREYAIHKELKAMSPATDQQNQIDVSEIVLGGFDATRRYGVKEGLRVTAQNLARFAAHRL